VFTGSIPGEARFSRSSETVDRVVIRLVDENIELVRMA
jgi:hypothetical protein